MCDADGHGCEPATQSFSLCRRTKASVLTKRYVTLALLVVPLVSVIVLVQLVLRTETKTQGDVPVLPVCIRAVPIARNKKKQRLFQQKSISPRARSGTCPVPWFQLLLIHISPYFVNIHMSQLQSLTFVNVWVNAWFGFSEVVLSMPLWSMWMYYRRGAKLSS